MGWSYRLTHVDDCGLNLGDIGVCQLFLQPLGRVAATVQHLKFNLAAAKKLVRAACAAAVRAFGDVNFSHKNSAWNSADAGVEVRDALAALHDWGRSGVHWLLLG